MQITHSAPTLSYPSSPRLPCGRTCCLAVRDCRGRQQPIYGCNTMCAKCSRLPTCPAPPTSVTPETRFNGPKHPRRHQYAHKRRKLDSGSHRRSGGQRRRRAVCEESETVNLPQSLSGLVAPSACAHRSLSTPTARPHSPHTRVPPRIPWTTRAAHTGT